ncbi:hypothetical protein [Paracoccus thiocyanatus]|uniref:hypothetical protein n=1 Tax=Paracoccus thiocyanatus TaxID=34006 RepID=UPI0011C01C71|nr:hypothetical protein [Paracoccus thiocyanatus]
MSDVVSNYQLTTRRKFPAKQSAKKVSSHFRMLRFPPIGGFPSNLTFLRFPTLFFRPLYRAGHAFYL